MVTTVFVTLKMLSTMPSLTPWSGFHGTKLNYLKILLQFGDRLRNLTHSHVYSKVSNLFVAEYTTCLFTISLCTACLCYAKSPTINQSSVILIAANLVLLFYHQVSLNNFNSLFNLILSNGPVMMGCVVLCFKLKSRFPKI